MKNVDEEKNIIKYDSELKNIKEMFIKIIELFPKYSDELSVSLLREISAKNDEIKVKILSLKTKIQKKLSDHVKETKYTNSIPIEKLKLDKYQELDDKLGINK